MIVKVQVFSTYDGGSFLNFGHKSNPYKNKSIFYIKILIFKSYPVKVNVTII